MKNIRFVICGLEHSGTTLLSDIFRQVPKLDSGFEVGVLLANSPRKFNEIQPFYNNMQGGWKVDKESLADICDTDDFNEFYQKLQDNSLALSKDTKHIFDKTPRYFSKINSFYRKIKVPFVATYKDPRSLVYSDFKRRPVRGHVFREWYPEYRKRKIKYLRKVYTGSYLTWKNSSDDMTRKNILCVSLEDICLNTRLTLEKIFQHVGYNFELDYLLLKNLRYRHTRSPEISSRIPFEYIEGFNKQQRRKIEKDFAEFEDWFYH